MALEVVSSILVARPTFFTTMGCRQVVKAPDFDSGIRRFKSCHPSQQRLPKTIIRPISSVGRALDF